MSVFDNSEHLPPTDTAPRATEHLPVSAVLRQIPRTDGTLPGEHSGLNTTYIDDNPPGVLPRRQGEMPLTERPPWHAIDPPAHVAALWAQVEALQDRADEIREVIRALPGDKATERRQVEAEMAQAIRAGKPADHVGTLTDWTRRQLALVTEHKVTVKQLRAKRAEYDAAVLEATPAWRALLVGAIAPTREKARKLVGPALDAVADWQARIGAAHAMAESLDPTLPYPAMTGDMGQRVREGKRAPAALAALLANDDPRVSGEYLSLPDDGIRPTRWQREAMARDGAFGGWAELAYVENNEGYTVTAYTKKRERQSVAPSAPFHRADGSVLVD